MRTVNVPATAPTSSHEAFGLNPCAANVNPTSIDGAKCHMKESEELLDKDKYTPTEIYGSRIALTFSNIATIKRLTNVIFRGRNYSI